MMKLSPKTKVFDNTPSPTRTMYDEDIDFEYLNSLHKKARAADEEYIEKTEKNYKEEIAYVV